MDSVIEHENINYMEKILKDLVDKKLSSYEIAKELNKSQTTVRYWLKKFGMKTIPYEAKMAEDIKDGELKECPNCKENKPLKEQFYVKPDGRVYGWCKACNHTDTIARQRERKRLAVEYKGGKCVICSYNKYLGALDFHHLDPSKKAISISKITNYSLESIKAELDKCICVCSNCHREIHGGMIDLKMVANPGF